MMVCLGLLPLPVQNFLRDDGLISTQFIPALCSVWRTMALRPKIWYTALPLECSAGDSITRRHGFGACRISVLSTSKLILSARRMKSWSRSRIANDAWLMEPSSCLVLIAIAVSERLRSMPATDSNSCMVQLPECDSSASGAADAVLFFQLSQAHEDEQDVFTNSAGAQVVVEVVYAAAPYGIQSG